MMSHRPFSPGRCPYVSQATAVFDLPLLLGGRGDLWVAACLSLRHCGPRIADEPLFFCFLCFRRRRIPSDRRRRARCRRNRICVLLVFPLFVVLELPHVCCMSTLLLTAPSAVLSVNWETQHLLHNFSLRIQRRVSLKTASRMA